MLNLKAFGRKIMNKGKLIAASSAVVLTTAVSAIVASADDGSSAVSKVITDAGSQLTTEFTNLASSVAPVLISIGVVGLGIYAVVYLFKMAKKFFGKAAG